MMRKGYIPLFILPLIVLTSMPFMAYAQADTSSDTQCRPITTTKCGCGEDLDPNTGECVKGKNKYECSCSQTDAGNVSSGTCTALGVCHDEKTGGKTPVKPDIPVQPSGTPPGGQPPELPQGGGGGGGSPPSGTEKPTVTPWQMPQSLSPEQITNAFENQGSAEPIPYTPANPQGSGQSLLDQFIQQYSGGSPGEQGQANPNDTYGAFQPIVATPYSLQPDQSTQGGAEGGSAPSAPELPVGNTFSSESSAPPTPCDWGCDVAKFIDTVQKDFGCSDTSCTQINNYVGDILGGSSVKSPLDTGFAPEANFGKIQDSIWPVFPVDSSAVFTDANSYFASGGANGLDLGPSPFGDSVPAIASRSVDTSVADNSLVGDTGVPDATPVEPPYTQTASMPPEGCTGSECDIVGPNWTQAQNAEGNQPTGCTGSVCDLAGQDWTQAQNANGNEAGSNTASPPSDTGDPYLANLRAGLMDPLNPNSPNYDPKLRATVAAVIAKELGGGGPGSQAVLESMVNRAIMKGYSSLYQAVNDGFYGPVNRGAVGAYVNSGVSAADLAAGDKVIAAVANGSNICNLCTDQGMINEIQGPKWQIGGEYFGYLGGSANWSNLQANLQAAYDANYQVASAPQLTSVPSQVVPASLNTGPTISANAWDNLNIINPVASNSSPPSGLTTAEASIPASFGPAVLSPLAGAQGFVSAAPPEQPIVTAYAPQGTEANVHASYPLVQVSYPAQAPEVSSDVTSPGGAPSGGTSRGIDFSSQLDVIGNTTVPPVTPSQDNAANYDSFAAASQNPGEALGLPEPTVLSPNEEYLRALQTAEGQVPVPEGVSAQEIQQNLAQEAAQGRAAIDAQVPVPESVSAQEIQQNLADAAAQYRADLEAKVPIPEAAPPDFTLPENILAVQAGFNDVGNIPATPETAPSFEDRFAAVPPEVPLVPPSGITLNTNLAQFTPVPPNTFGGTEPSIFSPVAENPSSANFGDQRPLVTSYDILQQTALAPNPSGPQATLDQGTSANEPASTREVSGVPPTTPEQPAPTQPVPSLNAPTPPQSAQQTPQTQQAQQPRSVVDYLNSIGQDASYATRATWAATVGIENYVGSAFQNIQLLQKLQAIQNNVQRLYNSAI